MNIDFYWVGIKSYILNFSEIYTNFQVENRVEN